MGTRFGGKWHPFDLYISRPAGYADIAYFKRELPAHAYATKVASLPGITKVAVYTRSTLRQWAVGVPEREAGFAIRTNHPTKSARIRWYYGLKAGRKTVFASTVVPSPQTHGHLFRAVVGPFRTRKEAINAAIQGLM